MVKTKLALDLLEQEMELLSADEQAGFVGGSSGWYMGVWWDVLPPEAGGGGGGTGGGTDPNEGGGSSGGWLDDFFHNNPEGTYTFGAGSDGGPVPIIADRGDYYEVSFDNGQTWTYTLETVDINGEAYHAPLYPLENEPYYDYSRDVFLVPLTTSADYNADHIMGELFEVIGRITGNTQTADWITSISVTDQSEVRAHVNDLLIGALAHQTGAELIPHASGPSTLEIPYLSSGVEELTNYMQGLSDDIYQELRDHGVLTFNEGGDALIFDEAAYNEYRFGGAFDAFLDSR